MLYYFHIALITVACLISTDLVIPVDGTVVVSGSFTVPNMFATFQKYTPPATGTSVSATSVIPTNSAIITFANEYHLGLVMRQIQNLDDTVLSSFILVAMDKPTYSFCKLFKYIGCVLGALNVPESDFLRNSYHAITYFKWRVAKDALTIFDYVFILDADLLLFKNPWTPIMSQLNTFDTWYQLGPNSGKLVFHKSAATTKYIDYVITMEGVQADRVDQAAATNTKTSPLRLDQDNIPEAITYSNITHASLPGLYMGHCYDGGSHVLILDTITYHICGASGKTKVVVMDRFQTLHEQAQLNASLNLPIYKLFNQIKV